MARHSDPQGRFSIDYEHAAIYEGIETELQKTVGQFVDWLIFDPALSESDAIYDVGSVGTGRQWKRTIRVPAFGAFITQGPSIPNDRGFYNVDSLRVSMAADKLIRAVPDLISQPDRHIRDRIAYRGNLFVPNTMFLKGLLNNRFTVISVDASQVNPDESVNDLQFTQNQKPYNIITSADDEFVTEFAYLPEQETRSVYTDDNPADLALDGDNGEPGDPGELILDGGGV
jgi:hypothetical protein